MSKTLVVIERDVQVLGANPCAQLFDTACSAGAVPPQATFRLPVVDLGFRHGYSTIFISEGSPLCSASNIACPSDRGAVLLMSGLV